MGDQPSVQWRTRLGKQSAITRLFAKLCGRWFDKAKQRDDNRPNRIAENHEPNKPEGFGGIDACDCKIAHIGDRVFKSAQDESRDCKHYAERRLLVLEKSDCDVHKDSAPYAAKESLPPLLREPCIASVERRISEARNGIADSDAKHRRGDDVAEKPQQKHGHVVLRVICDYKADFARVERKSEIANRKQTDGKQHSTTDFTDNLTARRAGEIYTATYGYHEPCEHPLEYLE